MFRVTSRFAFQCFLRCMLTSILVLTVAAGNLAKANPRPGHWVASWTASSDSPGPELPVQTLRQVMRVSLGGEAVRVRISNEYGTKPLRIGAAHLAISNTGGEIIPRTTRSLTRQGQREFTIGIGESILTDPAELRIEPLQQVAVSLFLPEATGTSTIHTTGFQTAYSCLNENQTRAVAMRVDSQDDSRYFITDIEVKRRDKPAVIVVVGDSTSDGVGTSVDSNQRWPDQLASRLQSDPRLRHIAVVNSGISGNRILTDGLDPFLGPSTIKRFERDALSKPGVQWVVLFQGINDITASSMFDIPQQKVTANQIIEGMKSLIARCHARNIRILGATLLPRQGATGRRAHTAIGEAMRQQVNTWIRSDHGFDGILDFDKVLRDPTHPDRQLPEYNSGDFSHPNALGYRALASSIDLSQFVWPR